MTNQPEWRAWADKAHAASLVTKRPKKGAGAKRKQRWRLNQKSNYIEGTLAPDKWRSDDLARVPVRHLRLAALSPSETEEGG